MITVFFPLCLSCHMSLGRSLVRAQYELSLFLIEVSDVFFISQTSLKSTCFLSSPMMSCVFLPEAVKHIILRASCCHCNIHVHMCSAVHQSKLLIGGLSIISIILNKYQLKAKPLPFSCTFFE